MTEKPLAKDQDKFIARLPGDLRDRLKEAATENGRSMNSELVQRLVSSFDERASFDTLSNQAFIQGMVWTIVSTMLETDDPVAAMREYRNRIAAGQHHDETRAFVARVAKAIDQSQAEVKRRD